MRIIDADALSEHKFLTPQVKVIGGRHNGKILEAVNRAYQQGWNDAIDTIVDNAPTIRGWVRKEDVCHSIAKQYSEHNELVPIWLSIGGLKSGADMRKEEE